MVNDSLVLPTFSNFSNTLLPIGLAIPSPSSPAPYSNIHIQWSPPPLNSPTDRISDIVHKLRVARIKPVERQRTLLSQL